MSLASALIISLSGLRATSSQLELTTSNISNSATEGYTTKSAVLTSATLGSLGGGVQVNGFTRAENGALFTTLTNTTSNAGLRSTQDDYLQRVQSILGTDKSDNPTLSASLSEFINAWKELAASPESTVAQRQVIQNASTFADEMRRISTEIEALDRECQNEIDASLSDLNGYLIQIRDINSKIGQAYTSNLSTGDFEDQRDQLVLKVAALTGVTVLERNFGQIALYTATGYQLVDGASVRTFSYDGADIASSDNPSLSLNDALGGGSLGALVDFRATTTGTVSAEPAVNVIQKLRSQLDGLADAFLTTTTSATSGELAFAAAYNNATTGAGELASGFFTGSDRTDFEVNSALLAGTSDVKTAAAADVTDAMIDATRVFTNDGLSVSSADYSALTTTILTGFQQAASNIGALNDTAQNALSYLKERHANETGVNVDEELVNLVTLQNAYAASAHAMSVVQDLFTTLERLL